MRMFAILPLIFASGWLIAEPTDPGAQVAEPLPQKVTNQDPDRFSHLPRLVLDDATWVATSPGNWDSGDWTRAGLCATAVLGTALLLDQAVDRNVQRHANATWDRMAKNVEPLGSTPSVIIAGGTYLAGVLLKDTEIRATGIDAMATMAIAQLMVTIPLKEIAGRSRPFTNEGTHDFKPMHGGKSFPSGHTTQAFALASVISAHADQPWVSCVSYGLAGMVGLSRVEQRQHFMSDVVMGALIGTYVGRTVVAHNQALRFEGRSKVSLSLAPIAVPGGAGLSLSLKF